MSIVSVDVETGATEGVARFLREPDCRGGETRMDHDRHFIVTAWERPERAYMLATRNIDPNPRASIASSETAPATIREIVEVSAPLVISELIAMITAPRGYQRYSQFASP